MYKLSVRKGVLLCDSSILRFIILLFPQKVDFEIDSPKTTKNEIKFYLLQYIIIGCISNVDVLNQF